MFFISITCSWRLFFSECRTENSFPFPPVQAGKLTGGSKKKKKKDYKSKASYNAINGLSYFNKKGFVAY